MSERVHLLAQSILGKSSLEECNLEEIRQLVQRYPYFAPAQFLYLQKLKSENPEEYSKQLQKAVLYYHNPLAFEYFISSDRFHTEINLEEPAPEVITEAPVRETPQPEVQMVEEVPPESEKDSQLQVTSQIAGLPPAEKTEMESPAPIAENPDLSQTEEIKPVLEQPVANSDSQAAISETLTAAHASQTKSGEPATGLAFEPYHTVDYFASQGIKLSQEEVSKDKFGRQLKSFTEWLKSMKRLPANQVSQMDSPTEQKVEHLAEDSVHNADVITEAMAEVWLKQGNREKAIETYNKLSLLNPSKMAYFATLIENLKRS
jgi:hypothetical protein